MAYKKFVVSPGFQEGGSLFKPEQLAILGSIVGDDAKIELTTFKQLYVEMQDDRIDTVQVQLKEAGLDIQPAGFYTKNLIPCNFCRGADDAGLNVAVQLDQAIVGQEVPSPLKIGYAGCALGTSEPLLKDIAVVKRDGISYLTGSPANPKELALATEKKDVYVSTDYGTDWKKIANQGQAINQ